jgi:hypothetical protein
MWLPDPVYKALPAVYLTGGVSAMFFGDNIVGYAGGVLLISGSLAIFKLRKGPNASVVKGHRPSAVRARARSSVGRKGTNKSVRPVYRRYRVRAVP